MTTASEYETSNEHVTMRAEKHERDDGHVSGGSATGTARTDATRRSTATATGTPTERTNGKRTGYVPNAYQTNHAYPTPHLQVLQIMHVARSMFFM